jgi:hypothetical protein
MRQQTWFATVVCTVAVIPGFIVGALFKALMYVFGGWAETSDFLFLHALLGFEAPGMIYHWIFGEAIPNFFQSLVAGFVAVWLMEKIAKGANCLLSATIQQGRSILASSSAYSSSASRRLVLPVNAALNNPVCRDMVWARKRRGQLADAQ